MKEWSRRLLKAFLYLEPPWSFHLKFPSDQHFFSLPDSFSILLAPAGRNQKGRGKRKKLVRWKNFHFANHWPSPFSTRWQFLSFGNLSVVKWGGPMEVSKIRPIRIWKKREKKNHMALALFFFSPFFFLILCGPAIIFPPPGGRPIFIFILTCLRQWWKIKVGRKRLWAALKGMLDFY